MLTEKQFEHNVNYIKSNYESNDGYIYPINEKHSAGYIIQSNNFTFTDNEGNIMMYIKKLA